MKVSVAEWWEGGRDERRGGGEGSEGREGEYRGQTRGEKEKGEEKLAQRTCVESVHTEEVHLLKFRGLHVDDNTVRCLC